MNSLSVEMTGINQLALPLAVAAPLLAALVWPARARAGRLAPWAALPALLVALLTAVGTEVELRWLVLGTRLGLDATARTFLFFTALLWGLGGWYARSYLATDAARDRFFLFYLLAMAGNLGLVLALDAPSFYAFFALMSFASYGLVIHNRDAEALRAGRIYIYLVMLGEFMLFAAFVLIAATTGSTRLPVAADATPGHLAIGLAVAGFGIKAGLLPLHVWLPLAHPVAPTPASAVLSGAMIKAGVIGWLRLLPAGQSPQPEWGTLLVSLGLAGAFFGVLVGVTQRNPKTVLAYSSISQMGFLTLGLGAGLLRPDNWPVAQAAVLLYALHHALAKGALFLGVGVAQATRARGRAWVRLGLTLPALALAGAPLTSGAMAKAALKAGTSALPGAWAGWPGVLLPLAAVGTTVLMARFLILVWPRQSQSPKGDLTAGLWRSWALLVGAVAVTFFVWPAAAPWRGAALHPVTAWAAAWPVLSGALVALAVWTWGRRLADLRPIPAGDWLAWVEPVGEWTRSVVAAARKTAARIGAGIRGMLASGHPGEAYGAGWPVRIERGLRRWPVSGGVFLLLAAIFVLLLAAAR